MQWEEPNLHSIMPDNTVKSLVKMATNNQMSKCMTLLEYAMAIANASIYYNCKLSIKVFEK